MWKVILSELKSHIPFTTFGAFTGIAIIFFLPKISNEASSTLFFIFHPLHVFFSAVATASIYKLNVNHNKYTLLKILLIGFLGSIGIATLSDSLIPFWGESLLDLPNKNVHIGFIEKWWLINPLALAGIMIAYVKPTTRLPHTMHVLISTWASVFHVVMAKTSSLDLLSHIFIFIFLVLAVWIPCCVSDIAFPLLFSKKIAQ